MADRQRLSSCAKWCQPRTTGVEQPFRKGVKFILIKRQLVIKGGQNWGNQTSNHKMSHSDERKKVLKSACAKNYGAILSMAQVFNDAAIIVLTDLPV
jgi:hypothetical protein